MKTQNDNQYLNKLLNSIPAEKCPRLEKRLDEAAVRTTLKLRANVWAALDRIGTEYGLSQKDAVQEAVQFLDRLTALKNPSESSESIRLGDLVRPMIKDTHADKDAIRKSVVLSSAVDQLLKRLLEKLKKEDGQVGGDVSRDDLVEVAVLLLDAFLTKKEEKVQKENERAREIVGRVWKAAEQAEKELQEFLPDDHPILEGFGNAVVMIMNVGEAIDCAIENKSSVVPDSAWGGRYRRID